MRTMRFQGNFIEAMLVVIVPFLVIISIFYYRDIQDYVLGEPTVSEVPEHVSGERAREALDRLDAIAFPVEAFTSSAFRSLEDITAPIPEEELGREDPFAPLPRKGKNPAASTPGSATKPQAATKPQVVAKPAPPKPGQTDVSIQIDQIKSGFGI